MGLRSLGTCVVIAVVIAGAAASRSSSVAPRFSLSAATARADDGLTLRVERALGLPRREIRLYLVPAGAARAVRTRFDRRLSFIGSVASSRRARLAFSVPPLEPGSYALAYWCRGCFPRGRRIGFQASPTLRIDAPAREGCATTKANGNVPPGAATWPNFQWHGNGALWAFLRPDGLLVTNSAGGVKQPWVGKEWEHSLAVSYRRLDPLSAPVAAQAVPGTLTGYNGPSWAIRMSFQPGCWQITGRQWDLSLSFVVRVELG